MSQTQKILNIKNKLTRKMSTLFQNLKMIKIKKLKTTNLKIYGLFILIALFFIVLWLGSIFFLVSHYGIPKDIASAGDMFGGIGALFSGLGLAGIIYALILQNREMKATRSSLRITARLSVLSALINEADNALMRYERWEKANAEKNNTKSKNQPDYSKAKKTVRNKLTTYRHELESLLQEYQP